ncbi:MAG: PhzF family phenazine biosynthesis isomerase [Anaerolineaceae bacterium]|nr:PhzF family phenazine biosynthesis isomerase [Anaerolineaceae bacterium]
MDLQLFQVDAFSNERFSGNPAAVCLLRQTMPDEWMRSLAAEMNLSETAFVLPEGSGYRLRWFTPLMEMDLCGHATLASAHVLFEQGMVPEDETISFFTRSGILLAKWSNGRIELDFPRGVLQAWEPPRNALDAVNLDFCQAAAWNPEKRNVIIEVADEQQVRVNQPDFQWVKELDLHLVILTARSASSEYDFVSRVYAPSVGVDEDPVTGSAHCYLGPYWAEKLGKTTLEAYQASARGGRMRVIVEDERVRLQGEAVTVFSTAIAE